MTNNSIIQTRSQNKLSCNKNGSMKLLTNELETMKNKKIKLQKEISELENKRNNLKFYSINMNPKVDSTTKWLDDCHIETYYETLSAHISKFRDDILLVPPSVSQIIQNGSSYDILTTLTSLKLNSMNIAFFAVSNCEEKLNNSEGKQITTSNLTNRGTHWSLLVYITKTNTFTHLDSIKGLNKKHAKQMASNINVNGVYKEIKTLQQISNFECGIHLLANTQQILSLIFKSQKTIWANLDFFSDIFHQELISEINEKNATDIQLEKRNYFLNNEISVSETKVENYSEDYNNKSFYTKVQKHRNGKTKVNEVQDFSITCKNKYSVLSSIEDENKKLNEQALLDSIKKDKCQNKTATSSINKIKTSELNESERKKNYKENTCSAKRFGSKNKTSSNIKPKIKILCDSHGRNIRQILNKQFDDKYDIYSEMKPNGKFSHILQNIQMCESKNMDKNDFVIVLGGTNDINKYSNPKEIIDNIELKLTNTDLSKTNVILSALPYRYDTPRLNKKINYINLCLQKMSEKLCNVHFTYLYDIHWYDYTRHGLHYNKYGKQKLANIFKNMIDKVCKINEGTMNIPTIVNYKAYSFLGKTALTAINT